MNRLISLACSFLVLMALVPVLGGRGGAQDKKEAPPALPSSVPVSSDKVRICVGPNIHASNANDGFEHRECIIVADPSKTARLFVAAICRPGGEIPRDKEHEHEKVVGYYSNDGGKTWQPSFAPNGNAGTYDPAAVFGPDGSLYFVCIHHTPEEWARHPKVGEPDIGRLDFSRSADGGKTWQPMARVCEFIDRPWLTVDGTAGKYRGRLYCFGNDGRLMLCRSDDRGKTFTAPLNLLAKPGGYMPANPVVLSDGTLVLVHSAYVFSLDDPGVRPHLATYVSRNGGGSLEPAGQVTKNWSISVPVGASQLAADTASKKYRDRLYAVWADGGSKQRARILFSLSKDQGRSWAEPQLVSEQPQSPGEDYAAYFPSVVVNKDGIVAVCWYDRRGLPPKGAGGMYPPGWNVRLRVSLDGCETWQSSIQVNEKTGKAPYDQVRDTLGLAADAAGDFHPVWIDDRTGKRQAWTAVVKVAPK